MEQEPVAAPDASRGEPSAPDETMRALPGPGVALETDALLHAIRVRDGWLDELPARDVLLRAIQERAE
jgi:hypothetical protein